MNILVLIALFALIGAALTFITARMGKNKSHLVSFLQHFVGVWFIFSGVVKAIDPLGTAMKMQDYFAEFQTTCEGSKWVQWLAPMFPWLSANATWFSIAMILLEIYLGVALIVGYKKRTVPVLFMLLMVVFTVLTGYTHLTGYVPQGENFFTGHWGEWKNSNMRVTDCGCFGDFLKLHPTTSFYKDCFLMIPAFIFLFSRQQHTLFAPRITASLTLLASVAGLFFCIQNTFWNEPMVDFRPFKEGVNVREQKKREAEAAAEVKITAWKYKNKQTNEIATIPNDQFMTETATYSDTSRWTYIDRIQTEPALKPTKITDFRLEDRAGEELTDSLLEAKGYTLLAISGKIYSEVKVTKRLAPDTTYRSDTLKGALVRRVDTVIMREKENKVYTFEAHQADLFRTKINPLMDAAEKAGATTCGLVAYDDFFKLDQFRHETQAAYPFYVSEDKTVKTIMRSNPGLLLLKDGVIVKKWHVNQLPTAEQLKALMK
jgi:uncharacterized membrane protein YphA (DoxX/SURF4 family)